MLPFFPFTANQGNNGAPNAPLSQQVNGNSTNVMPNYMPPQGQSQVGFNPNPRNPAPFNNPNPMMVHGNQGGFGLQNLNALGGLPLNGALGNLVAQNLLSGLLANGSMNAMNPNASLVNAQLALQNQLQNVNQLLSMALSNPSQLGSFNPMAACGNQGAQGVFPQNGTFPGNPQLGMLQPNGIGQQVNSGQQNSFRPAMNGNASNQFSAPNGVGQQVSLGQQNSFRPMMNGNAPNQQMQMNSFVPSNPSSTLPQNSQAMSSQHQGAQGNKDRMNISNPNHRQNRTFNREHKGGASNWRDRSQNAQNQYPQKMNRKQNFSNGGREIGNTRDCGTELMHDSKNDSNGGKKRSLAMHYSEKEIQQWREERKKFYPTKANVQKKQLPDGKSSGDAEQEAELRRQQLKNILAKQAELGFDVPEIPAHYLSDTENKQLGNDQRKRPFKQNDRFNNKRGRFNGKEPYNSRGPVNKDRFGRRGGRFPSRQQRRDDNGSWKNDASTRKPTLLEKLLTSDLKRDRCHLLQAFRFMVMNSFFEDGSTPLKFPEVIVKDTSTEVADLAKIEELVADEDVSGDEIVKCEAEEGEVTD
ncbi:hypothetical protein V2J09_008239 [Rumex salicifolius]